MTVQIDRLLSNYREIIDSLYGMGGVLLPLPVDPGPDFYKLPEIDLRVKIG